VATILISTLKVGDTTQGVSSTSKRGHVPPVHMDLCHGWARAFAFRVFSVAGPTSWKSLPDRLRDPGSQFWQV